MENIIPEENKEQEHKAPGVKTLVVDMPSNFIVEIREQDGNDDDVLSEVATIGLPAFSKFLAGIIIGPRRFTEEEIALWKGCDRYYLMMASRIFTFGYDMTFEHTFKGGSKQTFEEDLSIFMMSNFLRKPEEELEDSEFRAKLHPHGDKTGIELTLKSGKKVRYTFINGKAEEQAESNKNPKRNDEFRVRNLELEQGEKWQRVINFKPFSANDMRELRAHVKDNDYEFAPVIKLEDPDGDITYMAAIAFEEFFFPL